MKDIFTDQKVQSHSTFCLQKLSEHWAMDKPPCLWDSGKLLYILSDKINKYQLKEQRDRQGQYTEIRSAHWYL